MTSPPSLPAQGSTAWYAYSQWLDAMTRIVVAVTEYGAKGDGSTADTAAINAAISALPAAGGVLSFPAGGNYVTAGGHVLPPGTVVDCRGATITHTGNNDCLNFNQTGSFNLDKPTGVRGLRLVGNSGASAVGVEVGNCWGFHIDGNISGYTAGRGLLVNNVTNWCEGLDVDRLKIDNCLVGLQFRRTTGTMSFGYARIRGLALNVPASGIGIDLGGNTATGTSVYLYNADIDAMIWLNGNNAVAFRVGPTAATDNLRVNIVGEAPGTPTAPIGLKNSEGGTFKAWGNFHIKNTTDNITGSFTRVLSAITPTPDAISGGTVGSETFQSWMAANEDLAYDAAVGFVWGSSLSAPFVAGFSGGDILRAYSVPSGGSMATATKRFWVDGGGYTYLAGGGWNTGHLRMGSYSLWVDASGRLRIKSGFPTSDTDGTVVGSQV